MIRLLVLTLLLTCSACTDATWDKYRVLGDSAEVKCYSGGKLIFHGVSTGKVENETNSDGYFARWDIIYLEGEWKRIPKNIGTHQGLEKFAAGVGGDCMIVYKKD